MPSVSQKKYLEKATQTYAGQLHAIRRDGPHNGVLNYFREHAVSFDIAVRYELGFVAEPLPGDERFQGAIAIPYLSEHGTTAIRFRMFSGNAKIAQHAGQNSRIYNAQAYFLAGDTIGIAEGEMDAIAATEHLDIPTLGVPGVSSWKSFWTPLLRDFTKVLIFADGDQPGRDFASDVAEKIGWRAQIIRCPEGEDVSSLAYAERLDEITTSIHENEE